MDQSNKEHDEWVAARQKETQEKKTLQRGRLKTAARVVVALTIAITFHSFLFGIGTPLGIAVILLALRWDRAFPKANDFDVGIAGARYPWSAGPSFRGAAKRAFLDYYYSKRVLKIPQGSRIDMFDFIKKNLDGLLRDGPDLKRLSDDTEYAAAKFKRGVVKRYVLLLVPTVLWYLFALALWLLILESHPTVPVVPFDAGWTIIFALLTVALAWPIARSGMLGNVKHYMHSYYVLYHYLLHVKEEPSLSLSSQHLASLTREPA